MHENEILGKEDSRQEDVVESSFKKFSEHKLLNLYKVTLDNYR